MAKKDKQIVKSLSLFRERFLIGCIIFLFLIVAFLFGKTNNLFLGSSGVQVPTPTVIPAFPPTLTLTLTPTPAATAIPKKVYVDPDPIIDCNVTNLGTIRTKASLCPISFACEIGRGNWYLYTSLDKCHQDQNSYSSNTAPKPTVKSSYNDCSVGAKITQDNCIQTCLNQSNYNDNACKYAYRELNPNEELYNACYNQLMTEYNSCLDKCYQELKAKVDSCMK